MGSMARSLARERFAACLAWPDGAIDVAEAALWIAAEARPALDVDAYRARLAALAERAAAQLPATGDPAVRAAALARFLHDDAGLRGNEPGYYEPENSYLCDVLDRGLGIPITLAIVYVDVARRLGLDAAGVGFPGHFLVRVACGGARLLIDPFTGRPLDLRDCQALLARAAGPDARLAPAMLADATPREILARVLRNLKHAHLERGEIQRALACSERLLLVFPDDADERTACALLRARLTQLN
jgi:regulator of sirC expression with transglutaminase-like and TPR domain